MELYSYGIFLVVTLVSIFHVRVALSVRQWTKFYFCLFMVSILFLPIDLYIDAQINNSLLFKSLLPNVFSSAENVLSMCIVIGVCTLSLYAMHCIDAVIECSELYSS